MPTMREAYERHTGDMDPFTMDTLFLDHSTTRGRVYGLAPRYEHLAMFSIVNCNLTTLAGLPYMPQLSYLDVSSNQLGDQAALEHLVQRTPLVEKISMSANSLSLAHLAPLKNLTKLSELDLANNVPLGLDYRSQVFALLPTLKVLDGCDIDGVEMEDDDEEDEPEYHQQPPPLPPHRRNPPPHRAPVMVTHGSARGAPRASHQAAIHQINVPVVSRPRQVLVAPHRPPTGAPRQQVVRVMIPQQVHNHVYLQHGEEVLHEELVVEEEVVLEGDEEEYVDVDGLEGDVGSDEQEGELHEFLDDSAFTYDEDAYYNPEESISATIDGVVASSSGHYQHHQQQHHPHDLQNHASTSSASASTSSPRGIKRVAPVAAQPTARPIVTPTASSSSGEEVDVEGLEPKVKRIAASIDAVANGATGGPSNGSADDLNTE